MRVRSPPRGWAGTRGGGGSGACVVCGLSSRVGRGAGTLLADPGVVLVWLGAVCGLSEVAGRGASCFGRGALRHEGGGGGVGDGGGAPRWALLPSGLGWLGPDVIEDVLALPSWRRVWTWVWAWLRVAVVGGCLAAVLCFAWVVGVGFVGA